jgi:nicotinamidase-related amidase
MTTKEENGTVLLVMDIQKAMMAYLPDPEPLLTKVDEAITNARSANIPVIYVILSFRKGHPEINSSNKSFSRIKDTGFMFTEEHEGTALHHIITPQDGELVLHKKRISGFAGSDLDMVLKAKKAHHLIITGFATSGIVLNTVREAADKDFQITVLADACADPDPEVHDFLVKRIFPASGEVTTTDNWVSSLSN